ncbi:hypothetical protein GCM10027159_33200 [Lysobacter terrae]
MHGASAALRDAAAELGAGHAHQIAQYPKQGHVGRCGHFMLRAIDVQLHGALSRLGKAEPTPAPAGVHGTPQQGHGGGNQA